MNLVYNKKRTQYRSTEFLKILSIKVENTYKMICLATNLGGVHDGFIQVFDYYYIVTVKIYQVTIVIN